MGPGTIVEKRYDLVNKKPRKGYDPINKIDEISMYHDLGYFYSQGLGKKAIRN